MNIQGQSQIQLHRQQAQRQTVHVFQDGNAHADQQKAQFFREYPQVSSFPMGQMANHNQVIPQVQVPAFGGMGFRGSMNENVPPPRHIQFLQGWFDPIFLF